MPASLCLALPASLMCGSIRETHTREISMNIELVLEIARIAETHIEAVKLLIAEGFSRASAEAELDYVYENFGRFGVE